jgi:hypothetical protein|tara:strand:+ start:144 stop:269 length:126 start_codon:yes stop_codon:yes gene_type:complete
MARSLKPYFTAAQKSGVNPEKNGLPSEKKIKTSVYAKCGKK